MVYNKYTINNKQSRSNQQAIMINLDVCYRDLIYEIFFYEGVFYPCYDNITIQWLLNSYFCRREQDEHIKSTGNCVVCYENNVGTNMGCCDFKQFLCVKCMVMMFSAKTNTCPCCRTEFLSSMYILMDKEKKFHEKKL